MPAELREHAGRHYAVQFHYALPDDAWCVELSEAVRAPEAWADVPGAATHLPGPAFLVAVIPDEDPDLEPTVHFHGDDEHVIPYAIMRWFMENVAEEVERCRAALEAAPLVQGAWPTTCAPSGRPGPCSSTS
ncbi:hypothetical protein ABZ916_15625 [Streptomyces sp. NPDC046853]|uniref:hypothetical protein n=1 Tax=Streptomyces sp. NPDC046853 TaxID=3154920 RepID=UPI0033E80DED